jgi:hypothetical protein
MSDQLQLRRDTLANIQAAVPAQGEAAVATDTGQLFIGDGATAGGILTGPGVPFPGYKSSRYYPSGACNASTLVVTANLLYGLPLLIFQKQAFTKIGIEVTTGAATNCRLGIYANSASAIAPGALVLDAGAVSTASAAKVEATIGVTLNPGLYWLAALFDNTPTVRTAAIGANTGSQFGGVTNPSTGQDSFYSATQTYGALPGTFTAGSMSQVNLFPCTWLRL